MSCFNLPIKHTLLECSETNSKKCVGCGMQYVCIISFTFMQIIIKFGERSNLSPFL